VKKAGKDKAVQCRYPTLTHTQKGGNSNDHHSCATQRSHHEAPYVHHSRRLDRHVPGTWHWLPPALALEAKVRSGRHRVSSRKEACNAMRTVQWIDDPREV